MNELHPDLDHKARKAILHRAAGKRYRDRQRLARGCVALSTLLDEDLLKIRIEAMRRAKRLWFLAHYQFELPDEIAKGLRLPGDESCRGTS